jgi:hypothetical protein
LILLLFLTIAIVFPCKFIVMKKENGYTVCRQAGDTECGNLEKGCAKALKRMEDRRYAAAFEQ